MLRSSHLFTLGLHLQSALWGQLSSAVLSFLSTLLETQLHHFWDIQTSIRCWKGEIRATSQKIRVTCIANPLSPIDQSTSWGSLWSTRMAMVSLHLEALGLCSETGHPDSVMGHYQLRLVPWPTSHCIWLWFPGPPLLNHTLSLQNTSRRQGEFWHKKQEMWGFHPSGLFEDPQH